MPKKYINDLKYNDLLEKQKQPLKENEDYTDFVEMFSDLSVEQQHQFVREAFDIWSTLKTIASLIAPFARLFLTDKRLKQAFELIFSVLKEKTAKLTSLQVAAAQNKQYNNNVHQMISDLEFALGESGLFVGDLPKDKLKQYIASSQDKTGRKR